MVIASDSQNRAICQLVGSIEILLLLISPVFQDPGVMLSVGKTYESAFTESQGEIAQKLRQHTPMQAALLLEKEGWPREWACNAVSQIEVTKNPSGLRDGHAGNQRIREKLTLKAGVGGALFVVGLVVSLSTLLNAFSSGGFILVMYGAVIAGARMWMKAFPRIKHYLDRRLPVYSPPRNTREHNPGEY